MPQLILATQNKHKIAEMLPLIPKNWQLKSLDEVGIVEEIPEPYLTIRENAIAKAEYVWNKTKQDCFAEDTGLEIDSLGGKPGALSARYAGEHRSADDNMRLVLSQMDGIENRMARFYTVICTIISGNCYTFDGEVVGTINFAPVGDKGFGYDPIFIPNGNLQTFAEIEQIVKNNLSHRAKALRKFIEFIKKLENN
jgi:XTP/dITP diphosphohydrolase